MKYAVDLRIGSFQVDVHKRLRAAAFMDLAQEMAYLAAEAMHFGYDELQVEGKAWVLSRMHFRFDQVPMWGEHVRLSTWHKGPYGPFYLRDFRMEDLQGGTLVAATSSWVVLDVASRRMVRSSEVVEMIPDSTVCSDQSIPEPAPKVVVPSAAEMLPAGEHVVAYSDVDLLGHTNNVRYLVWALDSIGWDILSEGVADDVVINFNHETRPGERVCLTKGFHEGTWYVEGRMEDRPAFLVSIHVKR